MKNIFKNFLTKSQIIVPEKEKTSDEKIAELTNQLIVELKKSGRSIAKRHIDPNYGAFSISVYDLGTKAEELRIHDVVNGWEVKAKPTFTEF